MLLPWTICSLSGNMRILGICGSLRSESINLSVLRTARRLAPQGAVVEIFDGLGALPLFNPDLEGRAPAVVARWIGSVETSDALLIASPEYAHGVTGVLKNALDWLVASERFHGKPVAVLNARPRAHHADSSLREILRTMSANFVEAASVGVPNLEKHPTEGEMAGDPETVELLRRAVAALCASVSVLSSDS
jgi:chromate reductase, NAD(P)H dehydrogenase (quinone)